MNIQWWDPDVITAHLDERLDAFSPGSNLREDVAAEVQRGFDAKATPQEIIDGVKHRGEDGNWVQDTQGIKSMFSGDNANYLAERIARTESRSAYNYAAYETYTNNGVDEVIISDGLLPTSCDECMALDGTVINVEEIPEYDADEHPNGSRDFMPTIPEFGSMTPEESQAAVAELDDKLDRDGGFTYQPVVADSPTEGLMVGAYPDRGLVLTKEQCTPEAIQNYITKNSDLLGDLKNNVGGWYNPEDGKVYLDISKVFKTEDEARAACEKYGQLAWHDLATGKDVYLHPEGVLLPEGGIRSAAEANDFFNSNYGKSTGWDFVGTVSDENIDDVSRAFNDVIQKYPQALNTLKFVTAQCPDTKVWPRGAGGATNRIGTKMGLNPFFHKNMDRSDFLRILQIGVETGFDPKGTANLAYTPHHELGHALFDLVRENDADSYRNMFKFMEVAGSKLSKICEYAGESYNETAAELFAAFLGEEPPTSPVMVEWFKLFEKAIADVPVKGV